MFTHAQVWDGIDRLAKQHGLSASGLARRAGLDPTTFNPSKRTTKQAKPRWPSTESLAKILTATDTSFETFVSLMSDRHGRDGVPPSQRLRCVRISAVAGKVLFDESGFPIGDDWDEIDFPGLDDEYAYALEICGDAYAPIYRDGDVIIISPKANIRRHDRVALRTQAGQIELGVLERRTAQRIELRAFGERDPAFFATQDVAWLSRVLWASQGSVTWIDDRSHGGVGTQKEGRWQTSGPS